MVDLIGCRIFADICLRFTASSSVHVQVLKIDESDGNGVVVRHTVSIPSLLFCVSFAFHS